MLNPLYKFGQIAVLIGLLIATPVLAVIKSSTGNIFIDINSDNNTDFNIGESGLGVHTATPGSNLQVMGNGLVENGNLGIGTTTPTSTLWLGGTMGMKAERVTSNVTASGNSIILADTSSSDLTVTLPSAYDALGRIYEIKKLSTSNTLFVKGFIDDTDRINMTLSDAGGAPGIKVISDGKMWFLLSGDSATTRTHNTKYWISNSNSTWNSAANWSNTSGGSGGAGVPAATDHVVFDAGGTGDCRMDVAISVLALTGTSGYTGTLDATTDDLNHSITEDVTFAHNEIQWGSGVWTISGNLDTANVTTITRVAGGNVIMNGDNVTLTASDVLVFSDFTVLGNVTSNTSFKMGRNLHVEDEGKLTIGSGATMTMSPSDSGLEGIYLRDTGRITGAGKLYLDQNVDVSFFSNTATFDIEELDIRGGSGGATGVNVASGNYEVGRFYSGTRTGFTPGSGTFIFTGNVDFDAGLNGQHYELNNDANNPDYVFLGNVTITERFSLTFTWTKSSGNIRFEGGGNQVVDLSGANTGAISVDEIFVDKAEGSLLTLTGSVNTESLTISSGNVNINGQDIAVNGNLTIAANAQTQSDGYNGTNVIVTNNATFTGEAGDLLDMAAGAAWILNVGGATATASHVKVANSNASSGTQIDADDGTNTDGGSNTNWDFTP